MKKKKKTNVKFSRQVESRNTRKPKVKLHLHGNRVIWQRDTVMSPQVLISCSSNNMIFANLAKRLLASILAPTLGKLVSAYGILVPRGRDPSGLRQGSRPLTASNTGSPRFTDSLSNLTNLIG